MAITDIRVGEADFSLDEELSRIMRESPSAGGVASFVGLVRNKNDGAAVSRMTLEHYPGMTEKSLAKIAAAARERFHLVDVIENGQSDVVSDIEVSESLKILRQNMRSVLSDREYYIITKRFGLDGEKELTQRQIAKTLSISRSYVSRIERAGLKKLRKLLE